MNRHRRQRPTATVVEEQSVFPADSVKREFLRESDTHTVCGWKGTASYYDVVVDGKVNKDAAWYYPDPKPAAAISKAISRSGKA